MSWPLLAAGASFPVNALQASAKPHLSTEPVNWLQQARSLGRAPNQLLKLLHCRRLQTSRWQPWRPKMHSSSRLPSGVGRCSMTAGPSLVSIFQRRQEVER